MLFPSIGQHAWVCYLLVWLFPLIQNPPAKEQTKSHTQLFDEKCFRVPWKLVNVFF
jgi:hypothetical protein